MSQSNKYLADEWANFRAKTVPKDAGRPQLVDMERSFYAGALALYGLIMHAANDESQNLQVVAGLHDELMSFFGALLLERQQ